MNVFKNGWYSEVSPLWEGQCMSLAVDKILVHEKSKYQDVLVFQSKTYGTVLALDGVIQCSEKDEFSYQEMISFLPLASHPNPEKVLIIGGGDGGVAREVTKYPTVKSVTQCEIDEKVIEVSRKYLPYMAQGFSSTKLSLHIGDGFEFMSKHKEEFDVIITDSSDPIGPAESLFQKPYYELMKSALRPGGIISSQGECMWLHLGMIQSMLSFCKSLYPVVNYAYASVPTYPCGQIGFILCSLNPETNFQEPVRLFTQEEKDALKLKYYNEDVHRAAFALPQFLRKALNI